MIFVFFVEILDKFLWILYIFDEKRIFPRKIAKNRKIYLQDCQKSVLIIMYVVMLLTWDNKLKTGLCLLQKSEGRY